MTTIDIERNGRYIELRGWIGPQTPALCKAVGGGRFMPRESEDIPAFWRYPLDLTVCRSMRRLFGEQLRVGVELAAWSRAAVAAETELTDMGAALEGTLNRVPLVAPRMAAAMDNRPWQKGGAEFGVKAGSFLLSDQPRVGKTLATLATIVEAGDDEQRFHLIFCPRVAMRSVWQFEIEQWLDDAATYVLRGSKAQRAEILEAALADQNSREVFVVANIEMARIVPIEKEDKDGAKKMVHDIKPGSYQRLTGKMVAGLDDDGNEIEVPEFKTVRTGAEHPGLFAREWDTIVVDESHRALIRVTGSTSQQRAGFKKLRAARRIALSGTPMRGKPEQLWGTLNWLRPDIFSAYWSWVGRYFNITQSRYSDYVIDGWQDDGKDRMAVELQRYSLRRTRAEVGLGGTQYVGTHLIPGDDNSPFGVWLDMDETQRKQYEALEAEGSVTFADGSEMLANGILAENTRKKQFASACFELVGGKPRPKLPSPKFDYIVQTANELGIRPGEEGEGSEKLVVASQFTSLLNVFAKELREMGIPVWLLTGETPDGARDKAMVDFQSESATARVFLINTKAAGVAITLDAADDLIVLDETYIPDEQEQVADRIIGNGDAWIHCTRTLGTIEEEIAWITAAREDVQKYLLDGARGVEYARALYLERSKAA